MTATHRYVLEVKTSKHLATEPFVRELLEAWCTDIEPRLRPEFFSLGEPVRRSFEQEGVQEAVHTWLANQAPLMLRRKGEPDFLADIEWRPEKGKDPRPYPWGCTVWLGRSAGDELAIRFFRFLVDHFDPAFGSITTEHDSKAKHWITWEDRLGKAEKLVGLDVTAVLPGIYWVTYLGPGAMKLLGRESLRSLKAHRVEPYGDGCLVWAYESINEAASAARKAEIEIVQQLGKEHFFDKDQVNVEALKTDEVTAAQVERKIEQIKATRK